MLAAIVNRLWAMSIHDHNERDAEGNTLLMCYAASGNTEIVEALLWAGAGRAINAKNHNGCTALIWAAIYNHVSTVQALLRAGADINAQDLRGNTALSLSVFYGQTRAVWALLYAGADIDIPNMCNTTPLHWAASKGQTDIVRFLLGKGAKIHRREIGGDTALTMALENGHVEASQVLLRAGANIDALNKALILAAKKGYFEIAGALLRAGANIDAKSVEGDTALALAVKNCHVGMMKALFKTGIKPKHDAMEAIRARFTSQQVAGFSRERAFGRREPLLALRHHLLDLDEPAGGAGAQAASAPDA